MSDNKADNLKYTMGLAFLDENMRLSKKSVSGVIVLLLAGIAIVGWLFLSHQLQGGFGIYLSESNKLVISDEDIVFYNRTSHEIKLTAGGVEKIKALEVPLIGSPFVVKINEEEIYNGSFVAPISSIPPPPSEVIIVTLVHDDNTIQLEKGYPTPIVDPRNNSRLFDYFQKIGKLVH